jgi:predicted O-methyltransferase YrrM
MGLQELLSEPRTFAKELRYNLYSAQEGFFTEGFSNFHLSHTHSILYILGKSLGKAKYAEIGSHSGNSAVAIALSNPNIFLYCYDMPNFGWGGQAGTWGRLLSSLEKHAKGRNFFKFGDSHSQEVKDSIKENGPFDMFLVDGDHSEEGAYEDLWVAYTNLKDGGYLVFDDLTHHAYLKDVFDRFVGQTNPKESVFIDQLTAEEQEADFVTRGVGVLIK